MSVFDKLQNFIIFFRTNIDKSKNEKPYFKTLCYQDLQRVFLETIKSNLIDNSSHNSNDKNIFHNYAINTINGASMTPVKDNIITEYIIQGLRQLHQLSDENKTIILKYLEILDDNYNIKNNFIYAELYTRLLLINVVQKWNLNFSNISQDISNINNFLQKYKIEYFQYCDPMTYYWNIFNCKALLENEDIFTFITLLETLEKKYNYIEKLVVTPITKPEIVKLVISKTALEEAHIPVIVELKKKQGCDDVTIKNNKFYIKHLHLDKIKDEGLKFLCIKMDIPTVKSMKRDNFITLLTPVKNKIIFDCLSLEHLKLEGLIELCSNLNLNTDKCKHKRDDYLKLLKPYKNV